MERNATRMAAALNKGSQAMTVMGASAGMLQVAALAVGLGIMAVMESSQKHKETVDFLEAHYKKTLEGRGKSDEQIRNESAARNPYEDNPAFDQLKGINQPSSMAMAGMSLSTIWKALSGNPLNIPDLLRNEPKRRMGIIPDAGKKELEGMWADLKNQNAEAMVTFFDTVPDLSNDEIKKRSEKFQKDIDAKRQSIKDDPNLSAEQKVAYEAEFNAMENWWDEQVRGLIEQREGIKLLSSDMLQELQKLTGNLGSMDAVFATQSTDVADALRGMAEESGLEGPELKKLMGAATMSGGKQSQLDALAGITKNLLDEAAKNLISAQAGGDKEKIEAAEAAFWGASQNAASASQALLSYISTQANAAAQLAAFTGDFSGAAAALGQGAAAYRDKASEYEKAGDKSAALQARAQAQALDQQAAQQLTTQDSLGLNLAKSSTRNTAGLAQIEVQLAQVQLGHAVGVEAQNAAQVRLNQANLALTDVYMAQAAAARQTAAARIPPGDALRQARMAKSLAGQAMGDASIYGTASTQYQSALQQSIQAGWQIVRAERGVVEARIQLSQARATASGDIIKSAEIGVRLAKAQLTTAKKMSGGRNSAEVIAARASLVGARAALRDTKVQYELDTIDFNKEMGNITGAEAVKALQTMLKATNLTEAQRRDIMRKIKGLQDDIRNQLTGSGFNIPGEIKMPTAYEVRRSLGADAAREAIGQSVLDVRRMSSVGTSGSGNSAALVSAMQSVRDAVMANGAQIVNQNVDIVNQVPTAAIAKALVAQVVSELKRQSAVASRATTTTPRSVP